MDNAVIPSTAVPVSVFARMSARTKGMLVLGVAGLAALIAATWLWSATPTYRVLFTNLSDRDGGAIIAQLSQMNIPYKNADGGTILVPQEKVHEARLKLASAGLPKGSVVGFEVMETQKFGITQFQEQVNYQRALEGELARSVQSLAPVASARVHLALPKQSGFLRDKQPPTASVLIQLHNGKVLDRAQVAGIVHLVSSSVPELSPKNVSVVDQAGNLLASEQAGGAGLDAAQLDYVAQIEANTIKRIEDILAPIVGPGNVRAQVTADVDFSQIENVAETYGPNQATDKAAIRSQSTNESATPGASSPQGIPGALSNQPPVPPTAPINGQAAPLNANQAAAAATGNSTRREAVTNFEVDKTVRHTRQASGQIRRLTAAVVLNYRAGKPDGKGTAQATALSDKELQNVTALVREAMGFNQQRGDSLNVVNAQFSTPDVGPVEAVPVWKQPDVIALAQEAGKATLFLLLTLIVVFGVVRPALRSIGTRAVVVPAAGEAPAQSALPSAKGDGGSTLSPLEQMRQLAKNDPATVANVVKAWVGTEQKS
ncbi:MAG TPA: flagellar basal-body MS-ring/collar protein FliF [Burkholderiaceae bacterium]|nr:flagellar basal-body MS-ring/collar protein FliF [Burkholderiaceae bacterium]